MTSQAEEIVIVYLLHSIVVFDMSVHVSVGISARHTFASIRGCQCMTCMCW